MVSHMVILDDYINKSKPKFLFHKWKKASFYSRNEKSCITEIVLVF